MTLRFNKSIYSRQALEKSIKAYKNLAKFSLKEDRDYFILESKNSGNNDEILEKEFKNYVLMEVAIDEKK